MFFAAAEIPNKYRDLKPRGYSRLITFPLTCFDRREGNSGMHLLKRGSYYYICFKNQDGKEVRTTTGKKTKAEATEYLIKFRTEEFEKKMKQERKLLSVFMKEFERHSQCEHSPKTTSSYLTSMREFQRVIGDRELSQYGIRDVEEFILQKRAKNSLHSVRSYHTHLSAAFEVAKRWNYVEENPFRKVKRVRAPQSLPIFLTKAEFQKLLQLTEDGDLRDVMVLAVTTGMRLGEIIALKREDVNLANCTILIRNTEEFMTKTKMNRAIPMSASLASVLNRRMATEQHGKVFQPKGKRFDAETVSKGFKEIVRKAELNDKIHFHSLRHTFASWLVQGGVSLYEVQKLLGHSNIAVTQIYSHLQPETLHNTVNKITLDLN